MTLNLIDTLKTSIYRPKHTKHTKIHFKFSILNICQLFQFFKNLYLKNVKFKNSAFHDDLYGIILFLYIWYFLYILYILYMFGVTRRGHSFFGGSETPIECVETASPSSKLPSNELRIRSAVAAPASRPKSCVVEMASSPQQAATVLSKASEPEACITNSCRFFITNLYRFSGTNS